MTSKSNKTDIESLANSALDSANEQLSDEVRQSLAQARKRAVQRVPGNYPEDQLNHWFPSFRILAPVTFALGLVLLISYPSKDEIPVLPQGMFAEDIPTVDAAILEDLEFAIWLAEQQAKKEQEVVL